jgi:small nuclear ribonucleoprotein (snRNP)-like protein
MNLVLEQTEEIDIKSGSKQKLGTLLLKGDTISLVCEAKKKEDNQEAESK